MCSQCELLHSCALSAALSYLQAQLYPPIALKVPPCSANRHSWNWIPDYFPRPIIHFYLGHHFILSGQIISIQKKNSVKKKLKLSCFLEGSFCLQIPGVFRALCVCSAVHSPDALCSFCLVPHCSLYFVPNLHSNAACSSRPRSCLFQSLGPEWLSSDIFLLSFSPQTRYPVNSDISTSLSTAVWWIPETQLMNNSHVFKSCIATFDNAC